MSAVWISFIGFMASGKTSVARRLSELSLLPSVELDDAIVAREGRTIPEIFAERGERGFRELEWTVLSSIGTEGTMVISCGGGVVETPAACELLRRRGVVIWLDAPWPVLRGRLEAEQRTRPLIGMLGWDGMEQLYRRRRLAYAAIADFRLRSDQSEPEALAREALAAGLFGSRRAGREAS